MTDDKKTEKVTLEVPQKLAFKDDSDDHNRKRKPQQMNSLQISLNPKQILAKRGETQRMRFKKRLTMVSEEEASVLEDEDPSSIRKKKSFKFDLNLKANEAMHFEVEDEEELSHSSRLISEERLLEVKEESGESSKNNDTKNMNNSITKKSPGEEIKVKNFSKQSKKSISNLINSKNSSKEKREHYQSSASVFEDFLDNKKKTLNLKRFSTIISPAKSINWWSILKHKVKSVLHSKIFSFILTLAIIIILFIEEIKELAVPKEYDYYIEIIVLIVYCFFLCEFSLFCIFIRSYRLSFFFFVDLLSIAGLTMTIELLYNDPQHSPKYILEDDSTNFYLGFLFNSHLSKTSRASVSGTKIGRSVNFIKALNVFSLGRIYKHNLDRFIENNQEMIMKKRNDEQIRLARRKSIYFGDLKDKMDFFRQFHTSLRAYESDLKTSNTQLNPKIIDNFYDYAMSNEKKNLTSSIKGDNKVPTGASTERGNIQHTGTTDSEGEKRISLDDTNIKMHSKNAEMTANLPKKRASVLLVGSRLDTNDVITFERKNEKERSRRKSIKEIQKMPAFNKSSINIIKRPSATSISKICCCEETLSKSAVPLKTLKGQRRFSLISGQILKKTGEKLDSEANPSSTPLKKLKSNEEIPNFNIVIVPEIKPPLILKGLDLLTERRSSIANSLSSQQTNVVFCDKCGGLVISAPVLDETITTYLNDDLDYYASRRSSSNCSEQEHGLSSASKEESKVNSSKKHTQEFIVQRLSGEIISRHNSCEKEKEAYTSFLSLVETKKEKRNLKKKLPPIKGKIFTNEPSSNHDGTEESNFKKLTLEKDNAKDKESSTIRRSTTIFHMFNPRFFQEEKNDYAKERFHPKLAVKLSKTTTERVVFVILVLLFSLPFFDSDNYTSEGDINQYAFEIDYLANFLLLNNLDAFKERIENMVLNDSKRFHEMISLGLTNNTWVNYPLISEYVHVEDNSILFENKTLLEETRYTDRVYIENDYLYMIYDIEKENLLQAKLNIVKTFFIAMILWLGAFVFLHDINCLVVLPLEKSFRKIRGHKIEIENFYQDIDKEVLRDIQKLPNSEVYLIEYFFRFVNKLIIKSIGIRSFNYFKARIFAEAEMNQFTESTFSQIHAVIMVVEVKNLNECKSQELAVEIYSKICEIVDLTAFELFGEVIKLDIQGSSIIVIWEYPQKNDDSQNAGQVEIDNEDPQSSSHDNTNNHQGLSNHVRLSETFKSSSNGRDQFHSYEIDTISKRRHNLQTESETEMLIVSKLHNIKCSSRNLCSFALISAIKILARSYYSYYITQRSEKKMDVRIAIHKGNINSFIIDTSFRIENGINGYDLDKAFAINDFSYKKKYDMPILMSEKVFRELDEGFLNYTREVSIMDYTNLLWKPESIMLFAYDILYDKASSLIPYPDKDSFLSTHSSLVIRKHYARMINESTFSIVNIIKNDPEILYLRSSDSSTFIKLFQKGYYYYHNKHYSQAKGNFKHAILFRPNDKVTLSLIQELEEMSERSIMLY